MKLPDPVFFVGGVERSGTTLLRNMLTSHPELAVPDESYFIHDVRRQLIQIDARDDVALGWQLIKKHRFFQQWDLDPSKVENLMRTSDPVWFGDLVRTVFGAYAAEQGKPRSADKTPINVLHFEWLATEFPDSTLVHVVRDPRAVAMSAVVQPWSRRGMAAAARHWALVVGAAQRTQHRLPMRVVEIRYEDLIADPHATLERLCDAGGIEFSSRMLNYRTEGSRLPDRHHVASGQPLRPMRDWASEMGPDDISLVEAVAGPMMERYGYELATTGPTLQARSQLQAERLYEGLEWWTFTVSPKLGKVINWLRAERRESRVTGRAR